MEGSAPLLVFVAVLAGKVWSASMTYDQEVKTAMIWLQGQDTGISSKAIMEMMLGAQPHWKTYPRDSWDFNRCVRLMEKIPAWRTRITEMSKVGYVWAALVENWNELEALYQAEVANPRSETNKKPNRSLYFHMRSIIAEGIDADPNIVVVDRDSLGHPTYYKSKPAE